MGHTVYGSSLEFATKGRVRILTHAHEMRNMPIINLNLKSIERIWSDGIVLWSDTPLPFSSLSMTITKETITLSTEMANYSIDYLTRIPDELKIAIFSYLDTFDKIQLCDVSLNFQNIIFDKVIIGKIRLYKEYRFTKTHLNNFILNAIRAETITSMNINCVYWIPAVDLRNCICKLPMLECLYAIDTNLSIAVNDCACYKRLSNLKAIALTLTIVDTSSSNYNIVPETITNVYLHLELEPSYYTSMLLGKLLQNLKNLEKLWILDFSLALHMITALHIEPRTSSTIEKVTFSFSTAFELPWYSSYVTMYRYNIGRGQICLEKCEGDVNHIYYLWNYTDPTWDTLINLLRCELPFCPSDAKKLILKQSTLEDMQFKELNLRHTASLCSKLLKFTLRVLLVSSNMKALKKLSINMCLCEQYDDEAVKNKPLFKRLQVGMGSALLSEKSTLEQIVENSTLLEELEIWECGNLPQITQSAFSCIQNLKHLKKLTLQGLPPHLTGKYLIDICRGCTKLESLRIQASEQNNNLNNHLCMALPHTLALKDLRYEQFYIPIDKILDSLNTIEDSKLERVLLKCHTIKKFSVLPLETFVSTNMRLRFLCILISQMSEDVIRGVSKSIEKYEYSPEKVFVVAQSESIYTGRSPIPHIHKIEMLKFQTWVSMLDIFNGFENY